jgi:hypothetical protein
MRARLLGDALEWLFASFAHTSVIFQAVTQRPQLAGNFLNAQESRRNSSDHARPEFLGLNRRCVASIPQAGQPIELRLAPGAPKRIRDPGGASGKAATS